MFHLAKLVTYSGSYAFNQRGQGFTYGDFAKGTLCNENENENVPFSENCPNVQV